mmetsp:Transcript_16874/g.26337  ORF Transcript_16874/g.26337 Transcript_16874/m.26337 type:complete len:251 (+) Transcript_16874:74-826(+)
MWTSNKFKDEARALAGTTASSGEELSEHDISHNDTGDAALDMSMWSMTINPSMPSKICVDYPPFLRRLRIIDDKTNQYDNGSFDFEDAVTSIIDSEDKPSQIQPSAPEHTEIMTSLSEWKFSIAYSYIFQVPVLYFHAQHLSGQRFTRDEVLNALDWYTGTSERDSWDFVSEDEHPVTGEPYYYIHPCQTKNRMNMMIKPKDAAGISYPELEASSPPDGILLLSWLSMILPAVGYRVSAEHFCRALSKTL